MIQKVAEARLPTESGLFQAHVYSTEGIEQIVLTVGELTQLKEPILVRIHSECLTGDVFGSLRCDCQLQLNHSLALLQAEGRGICIYLRGHEGRGIGLGDKIRCYSLQEKGFDTVDANLALGLPVDARDYRAAIAILEELGVERIRLLTNNPLKWQGVRSERFEVVERIPLITPENAFNKRYLETKRVKLGHWLGTPPAREV